MFPLIPLVQSLQKLKRQSNLQTSWFNKVVKNLHVDVSHNFKYSKIRRKKNERKTKIILNKFCCRKTYSCKYELFVSNYKIQLFNFFFFYLRA